MLDTTVHGLTGLLVYQDLTVLAEVHAGGQVIWLHPAARDYRSPLD